MAESYMRTLKQESAASLSPHQPAPKVQCYEPSIYEFTLQPEKVS
jgi:hypothetical protein